MWVRRKKPNLYVFLQKFGEMFVGRTVPWTLQSPVQPTFISHKGYFMKPACERYLLLGYDIYGSTPFLHQQEKKQII